MFYFLFFLISFIRSLYINENYNGTVSDGSSLNPFKNMSTFFSTASSQIGPSELLFQSDVDCDNLYNINFGVTFWYLLFF